MCIRRCYKFSKIPKVTPQIIFLYAMQLVTIAEWFKFVYILLLRLALNNNLVDNFIAVAFHTGLILHVLIEAYLRLDIIS